MPTTDQGAGGTPPLDVAAINAPPGRQWTTAWTAAVDASLQHHLARLQSAPPARAGSVALVALGSYARRAVCPQSDIDLLLLHDGWSAPDLEVLVRAVCYPLWDAGLSVGHAVRTTAEAIRSTGDRIDSATALTERRLVAGSQGLADDLSARVARWLSRSGAGFARDIVAADAERHRVHGGTTGVLEPDLKDGNGGLRDLNSLQWAGAILLGRAGLDPLVGARYLGADDRAAIAAAGERLLAARCALHIVGGKGVRNTLRLDLQDEVAELLGMADGDELLRDVGLATRTIAHLHARTWPVLLADATRGRRRRRPAPRQVGEGLALVDGLIEVAQTARVVDDPSLGLRAVAAAAAHGTVLDRRSAMRLRQEVEDVDALPWDDRSRTALLQLLRTGRDGLRPMKDADYLGLMDAHLPEWGRVRGRPQRNPLHTYDLDTHLLHAATWLADVVDGVIDPRHRAIVAGMADPDGLVLATWLHDVGKAWPGDHSIAGETVGREWALHMGFSGVRSDRIARLIRLHLLLPDVATQRDLDDPDEIQRVAVTVGDVETLDGLYLLSIADSRATGKAAWSEWKDLLVRRLYDRVRAALQGGPGGEEAPRADVVLRAAAARYEGDGAHLRHVVDGLPRRYLRNASPEQVAAHASLLARHRGGLTAAARPGPVASTQIISLVATDRHRLFSDVVGVLAAHRVDVLEARVFTHDDGTALDWLVVAPPAHVDWSAVRADLDAGYGGGLDVAAAVARRERARDARPPLLAAPVPVRISMTTTSGAVTRVEVRGPDSPGLLFRVTRVLADMGTELLGALVATLGPEVRDAFFVRGDLPGLEELQQVLEPALVDGPPAR